MKNKICTKCKISPCASYHHCWCTKCISNYVKKRFSDPVLKEKEKLRISKWQKENPEKGRERAKRWRLKNPERWKEVKAKYIGRNPERVKERQGIYRRGRRLKVLTYYSNGTPKCECCEETLLEFLCLDHTDGGGNKHRKTLGDPSGTSIYQWIIKNNFPKGFRVLCYNCNNAYGHYGYCPHKMKKEKIIGEVIISKERMKEILDKRKQNGN